MKKLNLLLIVAIAALFSALAFQPVLTVEKEPRTEYTILLRDSDTTQDSVNNGYCGMCHTTYVTGTCTGPGGPFPK